ncbi:MAG: leucine-rich repeat domain-containing protein, partial [Candidatus Lokiarchaeota archaeon]|nr:leucine-rich repeat domain-containing protein [Candidatus Lokiarchaeota archaeon]
MMEKIVEDFLKSHLVNKSVDYINHVSGRFNNLHYYLKKLNIKVDNEFLILKKEKINWIDILGVQIEEKAFFTHSKAIGANRTKLYLTFYIARQDPLIMKLREGNNPDLIKLILSFFNSFIENARNKKNSKKEIKMFEHGGDFLISEDYYCLKFLEKRFNCTIPNCSQSIYPKKFSFGYRSQKGRIVFLNLSNYSLCKESINIEEIPIEIIQLKHLEELYLSNLHIKKLPHEINELNCLKILHVVNCGLGELPESIGELLSLIEIDLRNNNIRKLPKSMENLRNLKILSLERNKLKELPISLLNLPKLKDLQVAGNPIKYDFSQLN